MIRVMWVMKALQVLPEHKVLPDQLERKVHKALRELKVHKALRVHKVLRVRKALLDLSQDLTCRSFLTLTIQPRATRHYFIID